MAKCGTRHNGLLSRKNSDFSLAEVPEHPRSQALGGIGDLLTSPTLYGKPLNLVAELYGLNLTKCIMLLLVGAVGWCSVSQAAHGGILSKNELLRQ